MVHYPLEVRVSVANGCDAFRIEIYSRDTTQCVVLKINESERSDQLRGFPHRNLFAGYNTLCCSSIFILYIVLYKIILNW